MLEIERLGVVLCPPDYDKSIKYGNGHGRYAVFNAGSVLVGDKVHMLYRFAESRQECEFNSETQSVYKQDYIGYALFTPEGRLIKDYGKVLESDNIKDCAGVQDPRIVFFEDKYYIFYCAYNKCEDNGGEKVMARAGFAETADFIRFKKLGCIDMPEWDKDHFIFPERLGGKICLIHRPGGHEIRMDFFEKFEDILNRDGQSSITGGAGASINIRGEFPWESLKVGGGAPPVKTGDGWIFIYHGVEKTGPNPRDFIYSAGAALLDLKNPAKIKARLPYPLFRPETPYEKYGDVNNVVFPVGGYVYDNFLYISYGAADTRVAMCRVKLNELLGELKRYKTEE